MLSLRSCRLLVLMLVVRGLCGCGGSSFAPVSPAAPPTTLSGNWLLAGSRVPASRPLISASLFVSGGTVTGVANFAAECMSDGRSASLEYDGLSLAGSVAGDGSLQVSGTRAADPQLGAVTLSWMGSSPTAGHPSGWGGSYSLSVAPGTGGASAFPCGIAQTATFTAAAIAPVTGTYVGRPLGVGSLGADATVSLQLAQGAPVPVEREGVPTYRIPLTGTLTIANSPCAGSSSSSGSPYSNVVGDTFLLSFPAGVGSVGGVGGTLDDVTADSFVAIFAPPLPASPQLAACLSGRYEFVRQ